MRVFVAVFMLVGCLSTQAYAGSASVLFENNAFSGSFTGDAIYYVSHDEHGERLSLLLADRDNLCALLRQGAVTGDLRLVAAEARQRIGDHYVVREGAHSVVLDDAIAEGNIADGARIVQLGYMHRSASQTLDTAFLGLAADGNMNIATLNLRDGVVEGNYSARLRLGYKGVEGYLEANSAGTFRASHCPEAAHWGDADATN